MTGGGSDGGGGAKGGGGAQDGADVAGILNPGENDEEWGARAGGSGEEFVEREFAGLDESGDALGMLGVGDALEEAICGAEDREAGIGAADERGEALAMAFAGFAEQDGFDAAGGAQGFFDEAGAFDANGTVFGGKAAAEGHAELLEPAVFATAEEVGRVCRTRAAGGFGSSGHCGEVSKFAGGRRRAVSYEFSVASEERGEEELELKS